MPPPRAMSHNIDHPLLNGIVTKNSLTQCRNGGAQLSRVRGATRHVESECTAAFVHLLRGSNQSCALPHLALLRAPPPSLSSLRSFPSPDKAHIGLISQHGKAPPIIYAHVFTEIRDRCCLPSIFTTEFLGGVGRRLWFQ